MKDITLLRLKNTAKLESLITSGADYETILKQSQKIDKYVSIDMLRRNERENSLKSNAILHWLMRR